MIENANSIMKFLWVFQAGMKLKSEDYSTKYAALRILEKYGSTKHIPAIILELSNEDHSIRNSSSLAIKAIYERSEDLKKPEIETLLVDKLTVSKSLTEKIAIINSMNHFPIETREDIIAPYILAGEPDIQYTAINSISDTKNFEILDSILDAADNPDLLLRKAALSTWFTGLNKVPFDEALEYCTPRIHYLVRSVYELQTDGIFLKEILANVNRKKLPKAKAYPDFIIRYFTELLGKWEYDPDAFHSLHAILVPSYFTFDEPITGDDKPFIIL